MIKLYPHQEEAMEKVEGKDNCAFYLDMGLGKTFVGSEKLKEFNLEKNIVVVQKSKVEDWIDHFKKYYKVEVLNLRNKSALDSFMKEGEQQVGVINYDLIWRRPQLLKLKNIGLLLDESSHIKNPTNKRSKFIMDLQYKNVVLLSGTPVGGKYEELWSQANMLGWNITKKGFYSRYIKTFPLDVGGFYIDIVSGYKNIEELKSKLNEHGAVFMKTTDVIDLPDQIDNRIYVPSTPAYRKFKKDSFVELDDIEIIGDYTLTKMLGERQLSSIYNKNKETALLDIIDSTSDRIVIFYNFKGEFERIKKLIGKKRPISVVNGDERNLTHYEAAEDSITLVQYQAGAMGLNLQKANKIVYYSPTLSAELYMQSKKRIHRIKQEKTCFYYYLISKDSVEESIYKSLEKGEDFTNKLFKKA